MCYDESEFCLQFASDGKCINSALHKIANFCKKACGLCGRCQHGSAASQTPTPSHTLCTKDSSSAKYSGFDIVETTASISTKLCTTIRTIQPSAPHGWSKYASNKYKIADCRKFEKTAVVWATTQPIQRSKGRSALQFPTAFSLPNKSHFTFFKSISQ